MQFSQKLHRLLAFHGFTQEVIANITDVSQATVSRWLSGQSRPYERSAIILADFFRLDREILMDDTKELSPSSHHDSSAAYHHDQMDRWISQLIACQEEAARLTKLIQDNNAQYVKRESKND